MSKLTIRAVTLADLPEISRLWHDKALLAQQFDRRLTLAPDAQLRWSKAAAEWLADSTYGLFLAERESINGFIIGRVQPAPPGLLPDWWGQVCDLTVDAHGRQGGLGRLLLDALRGWFDRQGIHYLVAQVSSYQTVEQAFWRAQGAVEWMNWMRLK